MNLLICLLPLDLPPALSNQCNPVLPMLKVGLLRGGNYSIFRKKIAFRNTWMPPSPNQIEPETMLSDPPHFGGGELARLRP